jgi:hypothetical protein
VKAKVTRFIFLLQQDYCICRLTDTFKTRVTTFIPVQEIYLNKL